MGTVVNADGDDAVAKAPAANHFCAVFSTIYSPDSNILLNCSTSFRRMGKTGEISRFFYAAILLSLLYPDVDPLV